VVLPPQRAPLPQGQPQKQGAIINPQPIVNPAPAGNNSQIIVPAPQNAVPLTNPKALPAGKPAEQSKSTPNKPVQEDARLLPSPVVQPAAGKSETEAKNPF
jgi:hypothetical protein